MVAMCRVVKKLHGERQKVVFIGPCIAKKEEPSEVDEILTFAELRKMFEINKLFAQPVEPAEFDPPVAGTGAIFPVSRGLLHTIDIADNIMKNDIIVAEGRISFQEAIKEFESGLINENHLELLCCKGCIMGAGMSEDGKRYNRETRVARYVRDKMKRMDKDEWENHLSSYREIPLRRRFTIVDQRIKNPTRAEIKKVLREMGKYDVTDHLDCGACGYDTCEEHAVAIIKGLAETEMCLPYSIEKLHKSVNELAISNEQLASVQQTLKQTEKLAHMGQLSAGIAHELNNPLGVLIMYSNILLEETPRDSQQYGDLKLMVEQANRCKKIVSGLLNFARKNQVNAKETNAVDLVQQSIDAVIIPSEIEFSFRHDLRDPFASIDGEQMIQVLTNLMKNAIDAMPNGGELNLQLSEAENDLVFSIADTGTGISEEDKEKIFEPFFTTKGIGMGTGLGLATAYGIVKMHKGQITVESNTNPGKGKTGTCFTIKLPRNR
jgi:C4-dicarboxylate-specific signal transduction histidine kinase